MLAKIKEAERIRYEKKRAALQGGPKKTNANLNLNGGLVSLDQMKLDNKEGFEGDEFDPFSMGQKKKVDVQLKA